MEAPSDRSARTRRHLGTAFLVGFGLRSMVGWVLPLEPSWDGVIYERAARHLAEGNGYTLRMLDPSWAWPNLPTAFYPPGWPGLLSLVKLLGGPPGLDLGLQALLGALAVLLAARIGGALGGHRGARRTAWLVALWPGGVLLAGSWMGEPLFTLLLLAAMAALVGPRGARPNRLALSALLFGVAAYVRPSALALAPLALVTRALSPPPSGERLGGGRWRRSRARRTAVALSFAVLALVPLAPWLARNVDRLSGPVVTSSSGANLFVGALSPYFTRIPDDMDCPPGPRELARDRCRRDRALSRIRADPLGWMVLGAGKLAHTFGYEATPALQLGAGLGWSDPASRRLVWLLAVPCTLFYWGLLGLAVRTRVRPSHRVIWAAVAGVALVHFLFVGGDRYHLPLVPLIAALAACAQRPRRRFQRQLR